jgi:hypothetical protein
MDKNIWLAIAVRVEAADGWSQIQKQTIFSSYPNRFLNRRCISVPLAAFLFYFCRWRVCVCVQIIGFTFY